MNTSEYNKAFTEGRHFMREEICALIAHHMDVAKTFHGKGSDMHLRYKNLLDDIRADHATEIDREQEPTQDA
jgi:hypothetical protein